jgi:hypothetical protein
MTARDRSYRAPSDYLNDAAETGVSVAFNDLSFNLDGMNELKPGNFPSQISEAHRELRDGRSAGPATNLAGRIRLK